VHQGDLEKQPLGVGTNTPAIQYYLKGLADSPLTNGTLSQAVEINPRMDSRGLPDDFPVSFLPMEAVEDQGAGGFRLQTRPLGEVSKGYTPFGEGDIVWAKIAPCMQNGKSTVVTGLKNGLGFGSTEFHVLRPKSKQVLAEYVWYFLSFGKILDVAQSAFTGSAGQQRVPVEFLRDLPFPLPPLQMQQELVATMNTARVLRQQQLSDAEELMGGIDKVVLSALGIEPNPPQRNVFAVQAGQALGRVDADFHSPKFQAFRHGLENGKYPAKPIGAICAAVNTGFAAGRQDQAFDLTAGVPHLRPLNLNAYGELSISHTKFVPIKAVSAADYCQQGEVLFNNTNSAELVGKSAVFDLAQPCACSNHMTRLRLTSEIDPYYLAALFNALRGIGYLSLVCTKFNNQAGINTETLLELSIPVPSLAVQNEIVTEVRRRRAQAHSLREAAETGWANAKASFENQLLTPA
jgi:type I restriction enzyme S subunit